MLYGAYASFYTGQTRSYLRKKAIPFVERLPSHPRFREVVSVKAASKRIPILEAPDGTVIQDTTEIFEYLEPRFPEVPALPPGPRQRLAAYLVDLFSSENMRVAWHFRWNFQDVNLHFVKREFGRSFRPRGSNEDLDKYGEVVVRRMDGHRARIGIGEQHYAGQEAIYLEMLDILEAHFTDHPYVLGGLPGIADYGLMGPLFAHLGRDPYPLHIMQRRAPRVFRWVEHMNAPEVVMPEFADEPEAYLPDDAVPETVKALLRAWVADYAQTYLASAELFAEKARADADRPAGSLVADDGVDQPMLGEIATRLRGEVIRSQGQAHSLWVLQRTLDWLRALPPAERAAADELAAEIGAGHLLDIRLARPLTRVGNRLAYA